MKPSITIKGSIVMNSKAWDKQQAILNGWSPEEVDIIYADYEKYLSERYRWEWKNDDVMDFDTWWRSQADEAKERAKYE